MAWDSVSRRKVISAGAAAAAAPWAWAQVPNVPSTGPKPDEEPPRPPDERLGLAICGLGAYALEQIVPSLRESRRVRLAAVVTGDPAKGREVLRRYGGPEGAVYGYEEWDRLKGDRNVDAVYVITPNALHRPHVLGAAGAGKHVLCEKPFGIGTRECDEMIAACRRANVKLMVGYRAQYEPFNQEAIRRCRAGELGRLVSIVADHGRILKPDTDRRDAWRARKELAGGGSLYDIGIYSLNATMYLSGEEPTEVTAHWHTPPNDPRFKGVEDTVHWTLRFPSGLLANCVSSYSWSEVKRFQVHGEKASLELDPATDYYRHEMRITTDEGEQRPAIKEQNQFARQLDHFAEAVQDGAPIRTPGEMGRRDVAMMERIYESCRAGGRPVSLEGLGIGR